MQVTNLFSEARAASPEAISAFLTAAGFGDLGKEELLVLGALVLSERDERRSGRPGMDVLRAEVASELGLTGPDVSEHITALARRGYLKQADGQDGAVPGIAGRGYQAVGTAADSMLVARWADFDFRPGDIVISTLPKSGTTWMQMICAVLIFGRADLPAPMPQLSPRMEWAGCPRDEIYARLAAQRHRRFIKTHMALHEIPLRPEVSYIVVARHPLDMAVSMYYQDAPHALPVRDWLIRWLGTEDSPQPPPLSLPGALRRMSWTWSHRAPNVLLVHYEDLLADLDGEMRGLAARLGITVAEQAWPELVRAATFDQMRAISGQLVEAGSDPAVFFRRGSSGSGRELLTDAELAGYHERAARLAPPDLLAWLHRDQGTPRAA